jgi:hypothetical protein
MTHHHLTDEQISAFIDGEGADDAELLAQCETCRQRREQLEAARGLLRVPVTPVAPAVRAAAVAAALAGAEARNEPGSGGSEGGSAVCDLARPHRRRPSGELIGSVAAAVVVLGLAVAIPVGLSHGGGSSPSASPSARAAPHGPEQKSLSTRANPTGAPSALSAGTATGHLPDLGSINSTTSLRRRLSSVQQRQALRQGPANTGSAATKNGTTDQAAPPAFATSGLSPGVTTCVAAARAVVSSSDPLLLVATVRYRNTPALAVLVQTPDTGTGTTTGRRVVVVTRTDCRVLVVTKL